MNEQKTLKVSLPKCVVAKDNINYTVYYDHFDKHKDCDYSFLMRENFVDKVARAQNVNTFVLPNFKEKAIHRFAKGAFRGLKDVTLIVTGLQPISICKYAFDEGASVKLILPKDMTLFHIKQKCASEMGVVTTDFPMIAKRNLKLSSEDFCVGEVDEMTSEILPFSISVDKTKRYDRTSRTIEKREDTLNPLEQKTR